MNATSYTTSGGMFAAAQAIRFRHGISDVEIARRMIARRRASIARAQRRFSASAVVAVASLLTIGAAQTIGSDAHLAQAYVVGGLGFVVGLAGVIASAVGRAKCRTANHLTPAELPAAPDDVLWIHRRCCDDEELRELTADWFTSAAQIRSGDVDLVKRFVREKASSEARSAAFSGVDHQGSQDRPIARLEIELQGV